MSTSKMRQADTIKSIEWHQSQWQKAILAGDKDAIDWHKNLAKALTEKADEILKEMEK